MYGDLTIKLARRQVYNLDSARPVTDSNQRFVKAPIFSREWRTHFNDSRG